MSIFNRSSPFLEIIFSKEFLFTLFIDGKKKPRKFYKSQKCLIFFRVIRVMPNTAVEVIDDFI